MSVLAAEIARRRLAESRIERIERELEATRAELEHAHDRARRAEAERDAARERITHRGEIPLVRT